MSRRAYDFRTGPPGAVLGLFSIQEKAISDTRYHDISSYIMTLSLYIIVYHRVSMSISCPSTTHDINDIDDTQYTT